MTSAEIRLPPLNAGDSAVFNSADFTYQDGSVTRRELEARLAEIDGPSAEGEGGGGDFDPAAASLVFGVTGNNQLHVKQSGNSVYAESASWGVNTQVVGRDAGATIGLGMNDVCAYGHGADVSGAADERVTLFGTGTQGGANTTALGYRARTTGTNQVAIGAYARGSAGNNVIVIGSGAGGASGCHVVEGLAVSNHIVLGNSSISAAYIAVSWTVTSDARDKTNVTALPESYGLPFIEAIPLVEFQFDQRGSYEDGVSDGTHMDSTKRVGVLAQDVASIQEALGHTGAKAVDSSDPTKLSLKESNLLYSALKSIQQLSAMVTAQEEQIAAIVGRVEDLEGV